jgi:hypothetical protein
MSFGDQLSLQPLKSSRDVITAVRNMANQILGHQCDFAVLILQSAGAATVHANRIPELRAIVGTTVGSVDSAMKSISPNVLIMEPSNQSFTEVRNIFARFFGGGLP